MGGLYRQNFITITGSGTVSVPWIASGTYENGTTAPNIGIADYAFDVTIGTTQYTGTSSTDTALQCTMGGTLGASVYMVDETPNINFTSSNEVTFACTGTMSSALSGAGGKTGTVSFGAGAFSIDMTGWSVTNSLLNINSVVVTITGATVVMDGTTYTCNGSVEGAVVNSDPSNIEITAFECI